MDKEKIELAGEIRLSDKEERKFIEMGIYFYNRYFWPDIEKEIKKFSNHNPLICNLMKRFLTESFILGLKQKSNFDEWQKKEIKMLTERLDNGGPL